MSEASVYVDGLVSCAAPGCRCEFQTYRDLVQHLKLGRCGANRTDELSRKLPFTRTREDMASILYQRRFTSNRMSSPRNERLESGDSSQKVL